VNFFRLLNANLYFVSLDLMKSLEQCWYSKSTERSLTKTNIKYSFCKQTNLGNFTFYFVSKEYFIISRALIDLFRYSELLDILLLLLTLYIHTLVTETTILCILFTGVDYTHRSGLRHMQG